MTSRFNCQQFTRSDYKKMPWKNGAGVTTEIFIFPPNATADKNDFLWRLSLAGVSQNGPFSLFPGMERILTIIRGSTMTLRHMGEGNEVILLTDQPYEFSGDIKTEGFLPDGPVEDFNLIFRRSAVKGKVNVISDAEAWEKLKMFGSELWLFCLAGSFEVAGALKSVEEFNSLRFSTSNGENESLAIALTFNTSAARVICVQIEKIGTS